VVRNFKDKSFVAQYLYLLPKLMRDFKLFAMLDDDLQDELEVFPIHDDPGYRRLALVEECPARGR
jgi:spore cortex formation protein SpoVR/YcgB (stage V sporulation)